jgi:hypothetical protein
MGVSEVAKRREVGARREVRTNLPRAASVTAPHPFSASLTWFCGAGAMAAERALVWVTLVVRRGRGLASSTPQTCGPAVASTTLVRAGFM